MHLWYFSCFDCHVDVDNVQHCKLISFYRGIVLSYYCVCGHFGRSVPVQQLEQ